MKKQALVGMSGGVDSSVAAFLVREAGYDVTGATMRLFDNETIGITDKTCCSLSSIVDACAVANRLGIGYVVYDMRDDFRREVIDRFVSAYESGATPNPCVACNKYLKFDRLYELSARDLLEDCSNTVLPETDNLEEKYPVVYPTTIDTGLGEQIKAAVHFWNVVTDSEGKKDAFNHMQFIHFTETEDGLKADMCWAK